jgi:hypothetical protein
MKKSWNPAAFHESSGVLPVQERQQAWRDLRAHQRKTYFEWNVFRAFAVASRLDIDSRSVEMCDPNDASPPLPDVRCLVSGELEYFELGEVTSEDLARRATMARRNNWAVYSGTSPQEEPFVRIFLKKCRSRYTTRGRPLHLIMHYAVGRLVPSELVLSSLFLRSHDYFIEQIRLSPFACVWVYDDWDKSILIRFERR